MTGDKVMTNLPYELDDNFPVQWADSLPTVTGGAQVAAQILSEMVGSGHRTGSLPPFRPVSKENEDVRMRKEENLSFAL